MDINELIAIVKKKLTDQIDIERIEIEDKSFLHKNHAGNQEGRYHLKIIMSSSELKSLSRIESNKRVYKILGAARALIGAWMSVQQNGPVA